MSNTWKSCSLVAKCYPSFYPFLLFLFLFLFSHLKLRIACPSTSDLDQVLENRNEKICVGLTEEEICDFAITYTLLFILIHLHSVYKYRVVTTKEKLWLFQSIFGFLKEAFRSSQDITKNCSGIYNFSYLTYSYRLEFNR